MNKNWNIFLFIAFLSFSLSVNAQVPEPFRKAVASIQIGNLGNVIPSQKVKKIDNNTYHVSLVFDLPEGVQQDDWQINITPAFEPTFNWAPHLTPTDENIIDQHAFRAPAMIVTDNKQVLDRKSVV